MSYSGTLGSVHVVAVEVDVHLVVLEVEVRAEVSLTLITTLVMSTSYGYRSMLRANQDGFFLMVIVSSFFTPVPCLDAH